jgi:hypothetical protein
MEIRSRAERRIGELMGEQRSDFGLNRGTAGLGRPRIGGSRADPPNCAQLKPTLTEAGIDKHLANRVPQYVAIPVDKFEHLVRRGCFPSDCGIFRMGPYGFESRRG